MIIVQMASIPQRAGILKRVLRSLIRQVDEIHLNIAVNLINDDLAGSIDTNDIHPSIINYPLKRFMQHPKIRITFHDNSLQDGAKFINAPTEKGHYVLVCDDDIEYPSNFADLMTRLCRDPFDNRNILSCMGKNMQPRPITSYFKDEQACYKTFEKVDTFHKVQIPGSCAMAYSTDYVCITHNDMKSPNSDICVGAWAKQNKIGCYVIPHAASWLTDLTDQLPQGSSNMFDRYKNNDSVLTKFVNETI